MPCVKLLKKTRILFIHYGLDVLRWVFHYHHWWQKQDGFGAGLAASDAPGDGEDLALVFGLTCKHACCGDSPAPRDGTSPGVRARHNPAGSRQPLGASSSGPRSRPSAEERLSWSRRKAPTQQAGSEGGCSPLLKYDGFSKFCCITQ